MSTETDRLIDEMLDAKTRDGILRQTKLLPVARAALVAAIAEIEQERDALIHDNAELLKIAHDEVASGDVPEGMDLRTLIREAFIAGGREMCATGICIRAADEYAAKIAAAQNGPAHD